MRHVKFWLYCFVVIIVVACSKEQASTELFESTKKPDLPVVNSESGKKEQIKKGIDWFKGSLPEAFELVKTQSKPLFLYWGAEWCPPCNQLKATTFKEQSFIRQTRLVLPVYLDGDSEDAQLWGDKFGVLGYPTLIIFNPSGKEVTRIPGALDIERYNNVIDLVLNEIQPVDELVNKFRQTSTLSENEYKLLAYYSWWQDNNRILKPDGQAELFRLLAKETETDYPVLHQQFLSLFFQIRLYEHKSDETQIKQNEAQRLEGFLANMLKSKEIAKQTLEFFMREGVPSLNVLESFDLPTKDLQSSWLSIAETMYADSSMSLNERLFAQRAKVNILLAENIDISSELKEESIQRVKEIESLTTSQYERQAVINMAWYVLSPLEAHDFLKELLLGELDKSNDPYYWMSNLAELAKREGNKQEAIEWYKKAYDSAGGKATKFQWGINYLKGLIELSPEDIVKIESESLLILDQLSKENDALANRNRKRIKSLLSALDSWRSLSAESEKSYQSISQNISALCERNNDDCEDMKTGA